MTGSTASSGGNGLGLFDTTFSIGATAVSALALLLGIGFMAMGYLEMSIPVADVELSVLTGLVALSFAVFVSIVAFVAAVYMKPGFDDDEH